MWIVGEPPEKKIPHTSNKIVFVNQEKNTKNILMVEVKLDSRELAFKIRK
jgi:hypothetical protein